MTLRERSNPSKALTDKNKLKDDAGNTKKKKKILVANIAAVTFQKLSFSVQPELSRRFGKSPLKRQKHEFRRPA